MKANKLTFWVSAFVALATSCLAQSPPPNDNFTNRIPLVGSSVCWTGNTANATEDIEDWDLDIETHWFVANTLYYSVHSVWWSWVSPATSTVVVEKLGGYESLFGFLAVYSFDPAEVVQLPLATIELFGRGQYVTFNAQAGREYQIKLAVQETNDMVFRLNASDAPVFRLQPRTQTVSSNGSALFTAWAFGAKPLHYQWQYNGQDVPDATNAMLPIYSASATNAGEYCVVVSSAAGGVSTSAVAYLIISTNDPAPAVRAVRSVGGTNFEFEVSGEEGRSYLVESSTNLVDWPTLQRRLVVINTNQTTHFQIAQNGPSKFFRLSPYHPQNEICNLNMRQLRMAAWYFAEDDHKSNDASVAGVDLLRYMAYPYCPDDPDKHMASSYPISTVEQTPGHCFFGHTLEEPPPY